MKLHLQKLKRLSFAVIFFLLPSVSKAESGIGCVIEMGGGGVIYTTEFGDTNFFGTRYRVYNRAGNTYMKIYGPTNNCGETNSANVTSYSRPGYSGQCWVSNFHNPNNNQDTVEYGAWVNYTSVTPCPLDEQLFYFGFSAAAAGFVFIRRKGLMPNQNAEP